ncbi:hypothetical protein COLO4_05988 [Corchorus olitorius]|uniref:Uncharacterized protein n=1 Tax=Corchorus olitorius TaxID=93759 RepID=A0A1R3KPA1_9ROSI|nr:hypothetical protein COLO4_05988 [Corchorus olitorius]
MAYLGLQHDGNGGGNKESAALLLKEETGADGAGRENLGFGLR